MTPPHPPLAQLHYYPKFDNRFCGRDCTLSRMTTHPLLRKVTDMPNVPVTNPSTVSRFWGYVSKPDDPSACWPWQGRRDHTGYGRFSYTTQVRKKSSTAAHRYSYFLANGFIPDGMHICHSCDNRQCVNPAHLWPGTDLDNSRDKHKKGRGNNPSGLRNARYTRPDRTPRGETHPHAKLTNATVIQIRKRYTEDNITFAQIAREFGILPWHASRITQGKAWAHVREGLSEA
jgi:hypothetical protein